MLGDLAELAEEGDPVPLGALLGLAGVLVLPALAGGDADLGDRHVAGRVAGFRIGAQVADQHDFVKASPGHEFLRP